TSGATRTDWSTSSRSSARSNRRPRLHLRPRRSATPGTVNVPTLDDLDVERGQRVLVRVDFNVPLRDGKIEDDLRIVSALPTITALLEREATVACASHLGRPKGKVDPQYSRAPVAEPSAALLDRPVLLAPRIYGSA